MAKQQPKMTDVKQVLNYFQTRVQSFVHKRGNIPIFWCVRSPPPPLPLPAPLPPGTSFGLRIYPLSMVLALPRRSEGPKARTAAP
jgi:hypothetical protein